MVGRWGRRARPLRVPIERWALIVRGASPRTSSRPPIQRAHATCPTNLISLCASFNDLKFIKFLKYLKLNLREKFDRFRKFKKKNSAEKNVQVFIVPNIQVIVHNVQVIVPNVQVISDHQEISRFSFSLNEKKDGKNFLTSFQGKIVNITTKMTCFHRNPGHYSSFWESFCWKRRNSCRLSRFSWICVFLVSRRLSRKNRVT